MKNEPDKAWYHLRLRGRCRGGNVRDGFLLARSDLQACFVPPSPRIRASGPPCAGLPGGGCVNTHSLWVGWRLKGIFHEGSAPFSNKRVLLLLIVSVASGGNSKVLLCFIFIFAGTPDFCFVTIPTLLCFHMMRRILSRDVVGNIFYVSVWRRNVLPK